MSLRGALRKKVDSFTSRGKTKYPDITIKEPGHIAFFPSMKKSADIDIKYPLLEPFSSANIKWDPVKKSLVYKILEPQLSPKETEYLETIKKGLINLLDVELSEIRKSGETFDYIKKKVEDVLEDDGISLATETYSKVIYYIYRDFVGFNEIESIFHDPYIEDIGCSGLEIPVFVVHRKFGSIETNVIYKNADYLNNFVIKLAERCGRYISYAKPLLDGSLPDGSRVQATLAKDVTTKGPTFSIRKFRVDPFSPVDVINLGTASPELMAYVWTAVESKSSILICGGVSTGKTTFLNCISMFIPPEDKIVSIEDTRELNLPHENWIPSVSRTGFGVPEEEGRRYGEVTLFELLKESFRQNPDYVIVGEVRGKEAYVMFQGMASGHASIGTMHAGSVEDVIKRLETSPINLSPSLLETLDMIILMTHAKEKGKSARRVKDVVEIESIDPQTGTAHTTRSFTWMPSSDSYGSKLDDSYLMKKISFERGISYPEMRKEMEKRVQVLKWMIKHNITDFQEVCRMINLYYKDQPSLMEWVKNNTPPYKTKSKEGVEKLWETATGLKVME
jgi:flagellar protein FlaI